MKSKKTLISCLSLAFIVCISGCNRTVTPNSSEQTSGTEENSQSESIHTHTSSELLYNEEYHYTVCLECGEILYQEGHTLHTYYDLDYHFTQCEICDYTSDKEAHTLTTTYVDKYYHEISCSVCNYKSKYNHEAISSEDIHCERCNAELNISDITYTLDEESNSYIVTKYNGSSDILFIPLTHNGLPVSSIAGGSATKGAFYYNTTLKYVGLNANIESVGDYAFYNCRALETVDLPYSCKEVGTYSYCNCYALSEVNIDTKDATFGMGVFNNDDAISKITFKENAENIDFGTRVFSTSQNLDIYFNARLNNWFTFTYSSETSVPAYDPYDGADFYLKNYETNEYEILKTLNIPEGVSKINSYTFYNIKSLEKVNLAQSVSSIGEKAFYSCQNIKEVYCPLNSELTSISQWAFGYNSSLEEVIIPSGVSFIGHDSFYNTNLQAVFYQGDESSFNEIDLEESTSGSITFKDTPIYYYSEKEPTEEGLWWHYAEDGISPLKW